MIIIDFSIFINVSKQTKNQLLITYYSLLFIFLLIQQVGEVVTTIPTIGFNVETLTYKNLKFQVWDLGGQTSIRPYWRCYYSNTDAIIYVVDSCDKDRMSISKQELGIF